MKAILHTTKGDVEIELFEDHAPKTVANFTGLASGEKDYQDDAGRSNPTKFYDGLGFHRIIPGFMIQGGCPLGQGIGGPGYAFDDEIHPELVFDRPYLLAMANAPASAWAAAPMARNSSSPSNPPPWLNGKHTIFGEVTDAASKQVIDAIAAVPTGAGDRPVEPVVIESVELA